MEEQSKCIADLESKAGPLRIQLEKLQNEFKKTELTLSDLRNKILAYQEWENDINESLRAKNIEAS